ncbi:uncharacterized protein LOC130725389 [Lotus japonicus]|uniref:uncharacterized protein LOC130725389 n=1 Tax=Lotus japonicus TaxID=34305 RepID=UPI002584B44F|nr:uncharacterized protein LOC130725389 [Lotus japonicus]
MTMNEPSETIMEVREDFMVSPAGDSKPTFRTAHFLKPFATSTNGTCSCSETLSSYLSPMFEPKEWPLKVNFNGWRIPQKKWVTWVDTLHLRYEAVWKKVGIFEAIMSTRYHILQNRNLVFGVTEKWCSKTNTFVFPWGEATITLEDVMVLGGYPVVGDPVFTSLGSPEMREAENKMLLERKEICRSKNCKARASVWVDTFMNSGSEMEHEAFLATWLSVFVFPHECMVKKSLYPIAILLARGNPIALAPAVLASIYKDLGILKETMVDFTKIPVVGDKLPMKFEVTLESPFHLVQIWAWERFKSLQPQPNLTSCGDPALFRWHKVSAMKIDNVRVALNSAEDDFLWRPYVRYAGKYRALYPENEIHVQFEADLNKDLASFVTFTRVSELVGIDSTTMQYLPHRVAMQFGMDQDVPGCVPLCNGTKANAYRNFYFPARLFEADVTMRYARWWNQSVWYHPGFAKNIVRRKRSARPSKCGPHEAKANRTANGADFPPGLPPKLISTINFGKSCDGGLKTVKEENVVDDVLPGFLPKRLKMVPSGNSVQDCLKANQYSSTSSADFGKFKMTLKPHSKDNTVTSLGSLKEDFEDANGIEESKLSSDKVRLSGTQGERYNWVKAL